VRQQSQTTVFLTTHYLEEAEEADNICILDRGQVQGHGAPAQIKAELARNRVLIATSPDKNARLRTELRALGVSFEPEPKGGFNVQLGGLTVHALLRSIATPLDSVKTLDPSLEDAYLAIVGRSSLNGN
jgi:ABC-2 type transport system ATP-binding protein